MNIYTLDPRCIPAMEKVREYYLSIPEWQKDVREGKMFGVLIYSPTNEGPQDPPQRTPPQPSHKGRTRSLEDGLNVHLCLGRGALPSLTRGHCLKGRRGLLTFNLLTL